MNYLKEEDKIINTENKLGIIFITLGLEGSLEDESVLKLKNELDSELRNAIQEGQNSNRLHRLKKVFFGKVDALLDHQQDGPNWLKKYDLAKLVIKELDAIKNLGINLVTYTIMPNHIHLIFEPKDIEENRILEIIENFKLKIQAGAKELFSIEGNLWIIDNYVHHIYDQKELINIISYILENPVKAGLVDYWNDWPWSYCNPDYL